MIYVVKCFYCEHEFKVKRGETGADIMCPECGHANSIKDVIERIDDEKKKVDSDMSAIMDFDMSKNHVPEESYWEHRRRWDSYSLVALYVFGILLGVAFVIYSFWDMFKMIFK